MILVNNLMPNTTKKGARFNDTSRIEEEKERRKIVNQTFAATA